MTNCSVSQDELDHDIGAGKWEQPSTSDQMEPLEVENMELLLRGDELLADFDKYCKESK